LSICIATVNRAAFIGATLDSIISQVMDEEDDEVEIVIVDGASTDNTGDIVKTYHERFPRLRYHRLPAKGGVDQDYCRAVDLAHGDYCWLFTDDDILKPGAIHAVLAEARHDYGLILVNAEVRNASLSEVLEARRLPIVTDRFYQPDDSERLFIDAVDYLSFIGGVVIKRSVWNERDKQSYYGTVFVHVGVIFQAPMPGGVAVLAEPLISIRYGNALWTPRSFDISLFRWPELVWSFPIISEFAKRQAIPREPWRSLKALLIYRARGAFSMREYRTLPKLSTRPRAWRLAARVIALVPGLPLNASLVVFFSAFGRFYWRNGMRLVDLKNSRFYYRRVLSAAGGWIRPGSGGQPAGKLCV
jgi:glycosyltransferase involved in cell wall biosynthesis